MKPNTWPSPANSQQPKAAQPPDKKADMKEIDIILIILCVVTTIGFGTIFITVVRRFLEDSKSGTDKTNKRQPESKPFPQH